MQRSKDAAKANAAAQAEVSRQMRNAALPCGAKMTDLQSDQTPLNRSMGNNYGLSGSGTKLVSQEKKEKNHEDKDSITEDTAA